MRFLLAVSALFCALQPTLVWADAQSLPYELAAFYYMYVTQKEVGASTGPGNACGGADVVGFSTWVKCVMTRPFREQYDPPSDDDTKTPSRSNIEAVQDAIQHMDDTPRWNANYMQNNQRFATQGDAFRSFMSNLADIAKKGLLSTSDAGSINTFLRNALWQRAQANFRDVDGQLTNNVHAPNIPNWHNLVEIRDDWYDWFKTFDNIRGQISSGTVKPADGQSLIDQLNEFSRDIANTGGGALVEDHLAVIQQFQDIITETDKWIIEAGSAEAIPEAAVPESLCSPGVTKRSDSGKAREEHFKGFAQTSYLGERRAVTVLKIA